jgi:hypothetical protein
MYGKLRSLLLIKYSWPFLKTKLPVFLMTVSIHIVTIGINDNHRAQYFLLNYKQKIN